MSDFNWEKFKRIVIIGSTGSGKTTLSIQLSEKLGIPRIELDGLYWNPGWIKSNREEFRMKLKKAVDKEAWIIDGNYSKGADLFWPQAELVIWLDYPFTTILVSLWKRTMRNLKQGIELWPGCYESFQQQFFSKDSIFVWAFKSYFAKKTKIPALFEKYPHVKKIHIQARKELTRYQL